MVRVTRQFLFGMLMFLALFGPSSVASAAPISWSSVDVVLHADPQSPLLIVSGTVPEGTKFPAEGVLAVPAGAQLQWVGEVLGGPVSEDPDLQPQVSRTGDYDTYAFTMQKGPSAQVEALWPAALVGSDTSKQVSIAWVAPQDVPAATLQVRIPVGSQLGTLPPDAALEPGPSGYSYVKRTLRDVKAGDTLALQFAFSPGAAGAQAGTAAGAPATSTGSSSLVPTLLFVGTVAALVALFLGVRKQLGRKRPSTAATGRTAAARAGTRPARKGDTGEQVFDDLDEAASDSDDDASESAGRRWSPARTITIGVIVALIVGALVAVNASRKPTVAQGKITQQIGQVDQCTSATFALNLPQGTGVEEAAEELFAALRTSGGVGLVTVYTDDPRIEVGFCESNTTEEAVRATLAPTGLLVQ